MQTSQSSPEGASAEQWLARLRGHHAALVAGKTLNIVDCKTSQSRPLPSSGWRDTTPPSLQARCRANTTTSSNADSCTLRAASCAAPASCGQRCGECWRAPVNASFADQSSSAPTTGESSSVHHRSERKKERKIYARLQACVKGALSQ